MRTAVDARRVYRWIASAAVALTLTVVVASAYLRHSASAAALTAADPSAFVSAARIVHRLSATAVVAAILALLLVTWTQRPVWLREALVATAALVVTAALAVLGVATPGSTSPAIVLGNLLGGYVLLALVAAAWAFASASSDTPPAARVIAFAALVATFVVTVSGVTRSADGWHAIAAIAVVVLTLFVAYPLRRTQPRLAATLAATLAIGAASGLIADVAPSVAVLHNAATAVAVAALAIAIARPRQAGVTV